MTILLMTIVVIFLVVGEICGIFDRTDHLSRRFYVASGVVAFLLVIWLFSEYSLGETVFPEPFHVSYWSGLKISVEKCTSPC